MTIGRRLSFAVFAGTALLPWPASAQTTKTGWTGEGAFNAGYTTGNTETLDLGISVRAKHTGAVWSQSAEFLADYGDTDGVESRNRTALAGQLDRTFGDAWSGYMRLSWERDEFSGFENRYFAGVGLAFEVIDTNATKWTLEGGPGYKIDEVRATSATLAATEESLGGRFGSRFSHDFNERVSLSDVTEVVASETSTRISNSLALTAHLMGPLSARISFDVRHDTDPLPTFEATDTATKFSLVYKLE